MGPSNRALLRRGAGLHTIFDPDGFEVGELVASAESPLSPQRVLVAGDAAHINSAAGGQGMNSGIRDAHNLATRTFLLSPRLVRDVLAVLVTQLVTLPAVFRRVARRAAMFDTRYRNSSWCMAGVAGSGARAPDGPLSRANGSDLRLLDLVARDVALFLFEDGRLPRWRVVDMGRLVLRQKV